MPLILLDFPVDSSQLGRLERFGVRMGGSHLAAGQVWHGCSCVDCHHSTRAEPLVERYNAAHRWGIDWVPAADRASYGGENE